MSRRTVAAQNIVYTVIVKGDVILAFYSPFAGTFKSLTQFVLSTLNRNITHTSLKYEDFYFHCLTKSELTFVALTGKLFPQTLAFDFLDEIHVQFLVDFGASLSSVQPLPLEMQRNFSPFLREYLYRYNTIDKEELMIKHQFQSTDRSIHNEKLDVARLAKRFHDESLPPLLVQSIMGAQPANLRRRKARPTYNWFRAHPNTSFALSLIFALMALYLGVVVPNCGWFLTNKDENNDYICWFRHGTVETE